jgi:coenzyme PQQ precursor peptide PqqA
MVKGTAPEEECMSWTTPKVIEISVGMEINSYACADL